MIHSSITTLIGETPLIRLSRYNLERNIKATLLAKLEYLNPTGSVKDRAALAMIQRAEQEGLLHQGSVIIEPTSGNTGIGLAAVAAARGYKVILTMPDTMTQERRSLLQAYGAELVLTDGKAGMSGAVQLARQLAREIPNSMMPDQFENRANPEVHYMTTGPEIWKDTEGQVDYFVAGVGTGGTLTGAGRYLKEQNRAVRIVAVEPETSAVLSGGQPGKHGLQGIGAGFIPPVLDTTIYDEIIPVTEQDAFGAGRDVARMEGLLVGITSGAVLFAAEQIAKREQNVAKTIVVILPDSGDRYLSTPMFQLDEG